MKNAKFAGIIALFAIFFFSMFACSTDDSCACPNGTVHLIGETCCTYSDCTCETGVVGARVQGIAVTNRNNVASGAFNTSVARVEEAILVELIDEPATVNNMKTKVKEIVIITGVAAEPTRTGPDANGKYVVTITTGTTAGSIANYFYMNPMAFLQTDNIIKLAQFNTLKKPSV